MNGFIQEIQNLAHMEFIQFWREQKEALSLFLSDEMEDETKGMMKKVWCAAYVSGALASQKLTRIILENEKNL